MDDEDKPGSHKQDKVRVRIKGLAGADDADQVKVGVRSPTPARAEGAGVHVGIPRRHAPKAAWPRVLGAALGTIGVIGVALVLLMYGCQDRWWEPQEAALGIYTEFPHHPGFTLDKVAAHGGGGGVGASDQPGLGGMTGMLPTAREKIELPPEVGLPSLAGQGGEMVDATVTDKDSGTPVRGIVKGCPAGNAEEIGKGIVENLGRSHPEAEVRDATISNKRGTVRGYRIFGLVYAEVGRNYARAILVMWDTEGRFLYIFAEVNPSGAYVVMLAKGLKGGGDGLMAYSGARRTLGKIAKRAANDWVLVASQCGRVPRLTAAERAELESEVAAAARRAGKEAQVAQLIKELYDVWEGCQYSCADYKHRTRGLVACVLRFEHSSASDARRALAAWSNFVRILFEELVATARNAGAMPGLSFQRQPCEMGGASGERYSIACVSGFLLARGSRVAIGSVTDTALWQRMRQTRAMPTSSESQELEQMAKSFAESVVPW